jgi:hypothetical protein
MIMKLRRKEEQNWNFKKRGKIKKNEGVNWKKKMFYSLYK